MSTSERLHRTDAKRVGPLRHAGTYLRDPPSEDLREPAGTATAEQADATEGPVAHGVRLGYRVIEAQILEGQRLAQRLGKSTGGIGGIGGTTTSGTGDVNALIDRVLGLYKDLGKLCVDAVARSAAMRPPGFGGVAQPTASARGATGHETPVGSAGAMRFAVEVASRRRVRVTVELHQSAGHFVPQVHALHASDASIPALTAVLFDIDPASRERMLRIDVPDTQPAATYTGVVVDGACNEPRGFVSIRLLP